MRRCLIFAALLLLIAGGSAPAAEQDDEPKGIVKPEENGGRNGVDVGVYLDAGKALRFYDLSRLNHALGVGGVDPLIGMVDDWNFELAVVIPKSATFALAGDFWGERAGGSLRTDLSGWDILLRYGVATLRSNLFQLFPSLGIGYASHSLQMTGDLNRLNLDRLRKRETADLQQQGMLLEAGLRLDLLSAWPSNTHGAFLAVQSLTVGWQGVPVSSDWLLGTGRVSLPHDLTNALFVRFNLGFGAGARESTHDEE
jgi:hypothetical protein